LIFRRSTQGFVTFVIVSGLSSQPKVQTILAQIVEAFSAPLLKVANFLSLRQVPSPNVTANGLPESPFATLYPSCRSSPGYFFRDEFDCQIDLSLTPDRETLDRVKVRFVA